VTCGDVDIAISYAISEDRVVWWENAVGDASTWVQHDIWTTLTRPMGTRVLDVDRDGDLDVAVGEHLSPWRIYWFENTGGDGSSWTRRTWTYTTTPIRELVVADVNGDGADDLVTAPDNDDPRWLGNPTVTTANGYVELSDDSKVVWAADINGDGMMNPISAPYGPFGFSGLAWYSLQLIDPYMVGHAISNETGSTFEAAAGGDFDGDGDTDVIASGGGFRLFENTLGDGSVWAEHDLAQSSGHKWMEPADLDADGDLDVVGALGYRVFWHENLGGSPPNFSEHEAASFPGDSVGNIAVADMDSDGDLDVVASVSGYPDTVVYLENRGGQFVLETLDVAPATATDGSQAGMLEVVATHRGRPGDSDVGLLSWQLLFEESLGDPPHGDRKPCARCRQRSARRARVQPRYAVVHDHGPAMRHRL